MREEEVLFFLLFDSYLLCLCSSKRGFIIIILFYFIFLNVSADEVLFVKVDGSTRAKPLDGMVDVHRCGEDVCRTSHYGVIINTQRAETAARTRNKETGSF